MRLRRVALLALLLLPVGAAMAQETAPPDEAPPPAAPDESAPAPEQAAPPPPAWLPRTAATLILLDKIAAQPRTVTVPVGKTVTFGSLTIAVRACDVRPPDVPADATAFLAITDSHPGMPGLDGWIFADEPTADMLQHPVYSVRLAGCTG